MRRVAALLNHHRRDFWLQRPRRRRREEHLILLLNRRERNHMARPLEQLLLRVLCQRCQDRVLRFASAMEAGLAVHLLHIL